MSEVNDSGWIEMDTTARQAETEQAKVLGHIAAGNPLIVPADQAAAALNKDIEVFLEG